MNPGLIALAEETGLPLVATGDVHYLDAGDAFAHEALLCIQSGDTLKNPAHWKFDTNEFFFKTPEEMSGDFPGLEHALARTLEVAERCHVELELGRILLPTFPVPRGSRLLRLPRSALRAGSREAIREGDARAHRPPPLRAQDDQGDGLRGLLPHRLGLHPLREAERRQRRAGARLRCRVARRILPRDHRRRPDALRPPLRALPEPGAQGPAGHGHRLLGRRARPRHQLRGREVRARPRRADHHLLDDGRARGDPRRRPRPRHPLRRRRPHREARARGAGADARGRAQAGRRAASGGRLRPGGEGDRRPRPTARGPHARRLDPCGRRRHRRAAADRGRPAPAEGRRLGDRHAARDVGRRRPRPPEDGLPRPPEPRRHRQGRRARRRCRHRHAPARRRARRTRCSREAIRPASSSSSRRACATRCGR